MSDLLTFQPGVSLADGRYLLRASVQPGRWSVTIHGIRAADLTAVIIKTPIAPQDKSRFQSAWTRRTFQALGDFNHPSRARFLDWFEQGGRPFLVMQKVKGPSLEEQLQKGPLGEAVALQLIRQVAAGLAGIHSQGLLHRDIQPKNIILRQGVGIPMLVDWGLQPARCPADRLTPFSAPEQLQGGDIFKNRLDIYSLAATLYAAVTGQPPIHPAQRQYQVPNPGPTAFAGLIPPRQLQPDLSPATEQAILQGMSLDPAQRPATLENWLQLFPLSHSAGLGDRKPARSKSSTTPAGLNRPATSGINPGQAWATQPPPSQLSARQFPDTNPPAFSPAAQPGSPQQHPVFRTGTQAAAVPPSLPKRPSSPNPPDSNTATQYQSSLSDSRTSLHRNPQGSSPHKTASPDPSDQQQVQPSKLGTVSPVQSSSKSGSPSRGSPAQVTHPPKAMVGNAQRSKMSPVAVPFKPIRRLTSISLFMVSIGLAGGLLLRVLNPGSVSGFSGLGRVQNFPEADWPGETQLDDLPGDVPRPEYSRDESEEALSEGLLDRQSERDEVLAIPSKRLDGADRSPGGLTAEDYGEALDQAITDDSSGDTYDYNSEYGDEGSWDAYGDSQAGGNNSELETDPNLSQDNWNTDSWGEEAAGGWQSAPSITADDFPEPDLPPAYEAPIPQSIIPIPVEGDVLYEDV